MSWSDLLKLLFHEEFHIAPKVFPLAVVADFRQIYTSQSVHFESGISHLSVSHSLQLFYSVLNKIKLFLISDKISSNLNQVRTGLSTHFRSTHKKHTQDAAQRVYLSSSCFSRAHSLWVHFYINDYWLAPVIVSVDIDLSRWSVLYAQQLRLHTLYSPGSQHTLTLVQKYRSFSSFSGGTWNHAHSLIS